MSYTLLVLIALAARMCESVSITEPLTTSICLPSVCNDTKIQQTYPSIIVVNRLCCSACDCNDGVCHTKDQECASKEAIQHRQMLPSVEAHLECMRPQLKSDGSGFPYVFKPYLMVHVCPPRYSANESYDLLVKLNVDKCDHAETYADFDTRVPVYDIQTGLTFRNKFCATCHNISDQSMIFWTPVISCIDDAFWPDGYDNIVNAIQETPGCNVLFDPPTKIDVLDDCTLQQLKCNEHYDVNVTCYTNDVYTKRLCLITKNQLSQCTYSTRNELISLATFSLLLSYTSIPLGTFHTKETTTFESQRLDCDAGTFYDEFKIVCRNLTCVPPKVLRNGTCETMVEELFGASFSVNLKMTTAQPLPLTDSRNMSDSIMTFVHDFMSNNSFNRFYNVTIYTKLNTAGLELGTDVTVEYYVMNLEATSYSWLDAGFIDAVLELDNKYLPNIAGNECFAELMQTETIPGSNDMVLYNFVDGDVLVYYDSYKMILPLIGTGAANERVSILSSSGCPLVTLPATEFDLQNTTWGIHISDIEANISRWHFLENIDSGQLISVMVCIDTYSNLIRSYQNTTNFTVAARLISTNMIVDTPKAAFTVGILSLVCTYLSVMCMLLTLLTYGLFKVMRTQPGVNNMALCVSLILAQTMFQFGIMQKNNVPDWACKLIGVLIHFFWLNAILWMNVSSIHSFRIFWAITTIQNNKGSLKTTTLYFLYAFICSILPVAASLVANSVSDNNGIGYGKTICYLSESKYVQLTFAVPTAFFILINIGLFVAVVCKVRKLPVMSASAAKERQYLRVYFKLSSLTGFLWMFGFAHMFTGQPVLEYLFIVLNASQGIFIFVSFVCTKSCFRMYLGLFNNYAVSSAVSTKVTDVNSN